MEVYTKTVGKCYRCTNIDHLAFLPSHKITKLRRFRHVFFFSVHNIRVTVIGVGVASYHSVSLTSRSLHSDLTINSHPVQLPNVRSFPRKRNIQPCHFLHVGMRKKKVLTHCQTAANHIITMQSVSPSVQHASCDSCDKSTAM